MTPFRVSPVSPLNVGSAPIQPVVLWTVKERQNGVWVPVHTFYNLVTDFGLSALAAAPSGLYTPPTFLVIDTASTTMYDQANPGDTLVQLFADPTISGDNTLVLSVGLPAEETVTILSSSGSNPTIFNLTNPIVNTHLVNDPVVRGPMAGDTMSAVLSEAQYDPTFDANNRAQMTAAFSPGLGQSTMQFFLSGTTATNLFFAHVGLADQRVIGAINTNLHNYAALGYNHTSTNDVEIDVLYTLQRF